MPGDAIKVAPPPDNCVARNRLMRELQGLRKAKTPQVTACPSPDNILVWNYVIYDLPSDTPYAGGVYHGKLTFPADYPLKPPAVYMVTPNGRFQVNTKICLSMSDFHPETWNPSWRIETILVALVSFMLDPTDPRTTGGLQASSAYRQKLARESFYFNLKNKEFKECFPDFTDTTKYYPGHGFFHDLPPPEGAASSNTQVSSASQDSPAHGGGGKLTGPGAWLASLFNRATGNGAAGGVWGGAAPPATGDAPGNDG